MTTNQLKTSFKTEDFADFLKYGTVQQSSSSSLPIPTKMGIPNEISSSTQKVSECHIWASRGSKYQANVDTSWGGGHSLLGVRKFFIRNIFPHCLYTNFFLPKTARPLRFMPLPTSATRNLSPQPSPTLSRPHHVHAIDLNRTMYRMGRLGSQTYNRL